MMVTLGNFLFRYRTTISPFLILLLLIPGASVFHDPFFAAIAGLVIAGLGQIVRATTIGFDYIVRGGRNHRVYADGLVTAGLFHHTRNPMYIGKFFIVLGVGIASNSWPAAVAISSAYAFMYQLVVFAEEAYLRGKFEGAFDEYCAHVPRWCVRFRGLTATFSSGNFNWRRVLIKEYSAPLGWILPIVLIGEYKLYTASDSGDHSTESILLAILLAVALSFWLVAGWMKKYRFRRASQV